MEIKNMFNFLNLNLIVKDWSQNQTPLNCTRHT